MKTTRKYFIRKKRYKINQFILDIVYLGVHRIIIPITSFFIYKKLKKLFLTPNLILQMSYRFTTKLKDMFDKETIKNNKWSKIIGWNESNIIIYNKEEFCKKVLPEFNISNVFNSFCRSLHAYGFKKIRGRYRYEYFNKYFTVSGSMIHLIKRLSSNNVNRNNVRIETTDINKYGKGKRKRKIKVYEDHYTEGELVKRRVRVIDKGKSELSSDDSVEDMLSISSEFSIFNRECSNDSDISKISESSDDNAINLEDVKCNFINDSLSFDPNNDFYNSNPVDNVILTSNNETMITSRTDNKEDWDEEKLDSFTLF